jgi:hypothetical protein
MHRGFFPVPIVVKAVNGAVFAIPCSFLLPELPRLEEKFGFGWRGDQTLEFYLVILILTYQILLKFNDF